LNHIQLLKESPGFILLGTIFCGVYSVLAKAYWFRIPFIGFVVSTGWFGMTSALLLP
jgi:hypothetical protein